MKFKPFSQQEMKMLVFNKVRNGLNYDDALIQVQSEVDKMEELYLKRRSLEDGFFDGVEEELKNNPKCECGHFKEAHSGFNGCFKCGCEKFSESMGLR